MGTTAPPLQVSGDNSSPLSMVTTPAIHVTLHQDRRSFEVHRITNGGQLGGGVEFLLTDPDALDQLDPWLDLGDFDGDGDADIAVAFATTDLQGLPQGVVRLLRADWDASGGVTFVDTPLQALGSPIEAIAPAILMATEPMNSCCSVNPPSSLAAV